MSEERNCYIHNVPTRLSCASCGKPICPKCMINSHVGYKCKECGQRNITHIEKITLRDYILGSLSGLGAGIFAGYAWNYLNHFGLFISLLLAYAVGFCVSKAITRTIGSKIGLKIQIIAALIVVISMIYNPIFLFGKISLGSSYLVSAIVAFTFSSLSCIVRFLSVAVAVWAAIRHFKI